VQPYRLEQQQSGEKQRKQRSSSFWQVRPIYPAAETFLSLYFPTRRPPARRLGLSYREVLDYIECPGF